MEEASHGMDGWMHWMDVLTRDFDAHAHSIPNFHADGAKRATTAAKEGSQSKGCQKSLGLTTAAAAAFFQEQITRKVSPKAAAITNFQSHRIPVQLRRHA